MEKMVELQMFLRDPGLKTRWETVATELAVYTQDVAEEKGKVYDTRMEVRNWNHVKEQPFCVKGARMGGKTGSGTVRLVYNFISTAMIWMTT
jgi:hypothetical protein